MYNCKVFAFYQQIYMLRNFIRVTCILTFVIWNLKVQKRKTTEFS